MNFNFNLADALEQEPELAMMVSMSPVVFHRVLVDVTGAAMPALMLSACVEQFEAAFKPHGDDWFELNERELEFQTGLTASEQQIAGDILRDKGIIEEHRIAAATHEAVLTRINFDQITQELMAAARRRGERARAMAKARPRVPDHLFQLNRARH